RCWLWFVLWHPHRHVLLQFVALRNLERTELLAVCLHHHLHVRHFSWCFRIRRQISMARNSPNEFLCRTYVHWCAHHLLCCIHGEISETEEILANIVLHSFQSCSFGCHCQCAGSY